MTPWQSDPRLSRLVAERRAGSLSRRAFLTVLGGAAAGTACPGPARRAPRRRSSSPCGTPSPIPATRAAVKAIVDDFQKLHKDIEVRAEGMGWGDMDRKLQAAMAAKSPPTASHTQTYVVTSFRAKGLIEPMDDVVKAIGEDKIFPSVLQWLKYPDGKYWGITHAWGAEMLGGRGDYLPGTGVNPASWKTWDDWLRDLPKLNKAPAALRRSSLSGIPFFVNEDVYMWIGSNGGQHLRRQGQPGAGQPAGARDARVLEEAQALHAAGLGLARLSGDAVGVGHRQDGPGPHVGADGRLHRPVRAARQAQPGRLPGVAEDHRAHGQGAAHPVRQRAVGDLRRRAGRREGGVPGVPQVLLQAGELPASTATRCPCT